MPRFKTIIFVVPALLAAAGTYATPFQQRGLELNIFTTCKHNFAYTFNDGPSLSHQELVERFNSVIGKATFFVSGNQSGCIYSDASIRAIRDGFESGHQYASQTWSYANITTLNDAQIDEEIMRLDEAFVKILGVKPRFFRPPYGVIDIRSALYIQSKHNKIIALWDRDSGDSVPGANETGSRLFYEGFTHEGASSTHLTLSHESFQYAVDAALDGTVDILHNANITLTTVAGCLDVEPYEFIARAGVSDSTWTCEGTWTPPSASASSTDVPTTPTPTPTGSVNPISSIQPPAETTESNASPDTSSDSSVASTTSTELSGPPTTSTDSSVEPTTSADSTNELSQPGPFTSSSVLHSELSAPGEPTDSSVPSDTSADSSVPSNTSTDSSVSSTTSTELSGPPTTATSSIPPATTVSAEPSCVTQNYQSLDGETCCSIETKFALQAGSVSAANTFVDCEDIWTNTNLSICVPTLSASDPQRCKKHTTADSETTCAAVGGVHGVSAAWIKAWNPWVDCSDIWKWTELCIAH